MIDREKYPELYEATEGSIMVRRKWLGLALKAQELCDLLPEEIKGMHITGTDYTEGFGLSLDIRNDNGTITTLKTLGIQGLKAQVSTWSKDTFYSHGEGVLPNACKLRILVSNLGEPEGCQIVEKTRMVTEFVLVCEQTGQPV